MKSEILLKICNKCFMNKMHWVSCSKLRWITYQVITKWLLVKTWKHSILCLDCTIQHPIRLEFAITINKSYGQSLSVCGRNIQYKFFSHGSLFSCRQTLYSFWHLTTKRKISLMTRYFDEDNRPELLHVTKLIYFYFLYFYWTSFILSIHFILSSITKYSRWSRFTIY